MILPATEHLDREHRLPLLLLSQYLFFLGRRPVSESNLHYLVSRLRGLQSLAPALAQSGNDLLDRAVVQLGHLHPAAFRRIGPSLQLTLLPVVSTAWPLPANVVVQDSGPPAGWLDDVRRVLLVFGPGIGIGDELILAPLAQWLKDAKPGIEVATLSGYSGFWSRVDAVDLALQYGAHLDLLHALRGVPPYDGYDLVAMIDFESPELYRGVAADSIVPKYVELSIGGRMAFLFDSKRQWLYRLQNLHPYCANYYDAVHELLRMLRVMPRSRNRVVRREQQKPAGRLDVFVSPFTSKYDPSSIYWGRLLGGIALRSGPDPVTFHLDTGRNWRTRRFALELARAVAPALPPNVEVKLAGEGGSLSLTLSGVYDYLERCHAVVCSDSFAAHAGPLFDCLTLVLARPELKDWHVPSSRSFYFSPQSDIAQVSATMGDLLAECVRPKSELELAAQLSQAELELCTLADACEAELDRGAGEAFFDAYRRFARHYRVVSEVRRQNGTSLLFDGNFAAEIRKPDGDAAMTLHLRDQLQRWQNTNFAKYVRWARAHAGEVREATHPPGQVPRYARDDSSQLGEALVGAVKSILREQLPSGEIATYFRFRDGAALEYRRCPLISSFVHDALAAFDVKSRWMDTDVLDTLPAGTQGRFVRAAGAIRERIRRFLMWEEKNEGSWSFNGRGAGVDADADTTACVAATVLQAPRRKPSPRWRAHAETVMLHSAQRPDLIARVNILRFLALSGEATDALEESLVDELRRLDTAVLSGRYGHPLALAFCVARGWAQPHLPRRADVAELLVPHLLAAASADATFGGPLGAALAVNALADLEYFGPETIAAGQYLLDTALPRGGWVYAPFLEHDGGAPACTTALAATALARSGVGR